MQCLALGPYHIPGAAYSEVLSLKTLEALGAVSFPGLGCELQAGLCLEQLSRGCCCSAGKSWLWVVSSGVSLCASGHAYGTSWNLDPEWEQAEPGHILSTACTFTRAGMPKQ